MTTQAQLYYNAPIVSDWRHWEIENTHRPRFTPAKRVVLRHQNCYGFIVETEHWSPESVEREVRAAAAMGRSRVVDG